MARLRGWLRRERAADPSLFTARALLSAILLFLVLYLIFGDHPWSSGIAERVREGKVIRPIDYKRTYGGWVALANALLVGGLLASARRWVGSGSPAFSAEVASWRRPWSRTFAALVAGAVLATALLAWPRLTQSFWDDEEYCIRKYVDGTYGRDEAGRLVAQRPKWRDTVWDDREANNHIPYSILARLSLAGWRVATQPTLAFADERSVRIPAYLPALAGIAVTAACLARLGFPAAGLLAAWLLALHPWYVRYASEARGYGMLLLLVPATWLLLLRALEQGSWRRWLGYAAAQCLLLWTHPGMLYQLALTNAAALAVLAWLHRATPALGQQTLRWLVANVASAALFAQLMVPCLVQVSHYLADWRGRVYRVPLEDVLSFLLSGVEWKNRDRHYVTLRGISWSDPLLFRSAVVVTPLLLAAGAGRLLAAGRARALLLPMLLLPGPLLYLASVVRQDRFYPWYVVFALPAGAALVGLGLSAPLAALRRHRSGALVGALVAVAYLTLFAAVTREPRRALRESSLVPVRESVLLTRPTLDPFSPANQRIVTVSFSRSPVYYDPLVRWVTSRAELYREMRRADRLGLTLYVNIGRPEIARRSVPKLWELVQREEVFQEVATLYGVEKRGKRHVYRYRGAAAPAAGADP